MLKGLRSLGRQKRFINKKYLYCFTLRRQFRRMRTRCSRSRQKTRQFVCDLEQVQLSRARCDDAARYVIPSTKPKCQGGLRYHRSWQRGVPGGVAPKDNPGIDEKTGFCVPAVVREYSVVSATFHFKFEHRFIRKRGALL